MNCKGNKRGVFAYVMGVFVEKRRHIFALAAFTLFIFVTSISDEASYVMRFIAMLNTFGHKYEGILILVEVLGVFYGVTVILSNDRKRQIQNKESESHKQETHELDNPEPAAEPKKVKSITSAPSPAATDQWVHPANAKDKPKSTMSQYAGRIQPKKKKESETRPVNPQNKWKLKGKIKKKISYYRRDEK